MHFLSRIWSHGTLFILSQTVGLKIEMKGKKPKKSALFAIQHQSALETIAFSFFIPNTIFVLKRELFWLPFFGLALIKLGHIGINRKMGRKAILKIKEHSKDRFKEGYNIAIFPEGTRCPVGKIGRIGSGIAILSETLNQGVIPVSLNTGKFWKRNAFVKEKGIAVLKIKKEILPTTRPNLLKQIKDSFE
ncbi:MAG: lysophospholipid acyltransferase family protein [Alphaproteobacteria bacterium]